MVPAPANMPPGERSRLPWRRPILHTRLIRKLEHFDHLSNDERQLLKGAVDRSRAVNRGDDIIQEGNRPTESILLLEGFAGRYDLLRNGKRQITALHVPGDFVGLHSFLMRTIDHSVLAMTPCSVGFVPHEFLRGISENHPHLARLLGLNIAVDAASYRQWIASMGRRSALEHAAHLICELFLRLRAVGLTEDDSFRFPLTQSELGDTLGLSTVHVNRVVQDLRKKGLITWHGETLVTEDWDRLQQLAEFDPTFLSQEVEPR
jgi:CRP-like cAMP-binding protein